jgi:hypothetical protein
MTALSLRVTQLCKGTFECHDARSQQSHPLQDADRNLRRFVNDQNRIKIDFSRSGKRTDNAYVEVQGLAGRSVYHLDNYLWSFGKNLYTAAANSDASLTVEMSQP